MLVERRIARPYRGLVDADVFVRVGVFDYRAKKREDCGECISALNSKTFNRRKSFAERTTSPESAAYCASALGATRICNLSCALANSQFSSKFPMDVFVRH